MSSVPSPALGAAPVREPGAGLVPHRLGVLAASAAARTGLAAFHRALVAVGLGHYNLVRLSSVIPPRTLVGAGRGAGVPTLHPHRRDDRPDDFVDGSVGDRVYCVYAERGTDVVGEEVWAGVGWVQRSDGLGGFFVEHDGSSADAVRQAITTSLEDMVADEDATYEAPLMVLEGALCDGDPVCALVVVPYAAVAW